MFGCLSSRDARFIQGLGFVGKKTAKGGHLAYKKYESSDYVRRKEREKRIAAINAGKDPAQLKKSDSQVYTTLCSIYDAYRLCSNPSLLFSLNSPQYEDWIGNAGCREE